MFQVQIQDSLIGRKGCQDNFLDNKTFEVLMMKDYECTILDLGSQAPNFNIELWISLRTENQATKPNSRTEPNQTQQLNQTDCLKSKLILVIIFCRSDILGPGNCITKSKFPNKQHKSISLKCI